MYADGCCRDRQGWRMALPRQTARALDWTGCRGSGGPRRAEPLGCCETCCRDSARAVMPSCPRARWPSRGSAPVDCPAACSCGCCCCRCRRCCCTRRDAWWARAGTATGSARQSPEGRRLAGEIARGGCWTRLCGPSWERCRGRGSDAWCGRA